MSKEITFCMIKPDTIKDKNMGAILTYLEKKDFEFLHIKKMNLSIDFCKDFYIEHKSKEFFSSLVDFITSGPVIALVLKRENACHYLREIMGATNPKEASSTSIRALYGKSVENNAIHGSDSLKSAKRELSLFFPEVMS